MNRTFETQFPGDETKDQQLDMLRVRLGRMTYPGYPALGDRLVADLAGLDATPEGRLVLPDGPWSVDEHPNRRQAHSLPTLQQQEDFLAQGLRLDSKGRPLHPWLKDMIEDPSIGVVTGKGFYYEWGENPTVDAIVVRNGEEVLLVRRKDTGVLAFPGGFRDEEDARAGAARELREESGIVIEDPSVGITVYEGLIMDTRVTAHAWTSTSAFMFNLYGETPEPVAADDASDAGWFPLEQAERETMLFGAHRVLLQKAIEKL